MDKATILKNIGMIGKASKKLVDQIQETAVACAIHAIRHGDITLADQLVDAVGKGIRRASLRAWFERQGPFVIAKGKDKFSFAKEKAAELRLMNDPELAEKLDSLKWEDAKPEAPVVSVFDVSEAVDNFLKRLQKQVSEAQVTVKNRKLLEEVAYATSKYHALQVLNSRADLPDEESAPKS